MPRTEAITLGVAQVLAQPLAAYLLSSDWKQFAGIWIALWVITPIIKGKA